MSKKYVVVHAFKDLQDKNKIYQVGEPYPKPANKKITAARLKQLTTKDNRLGEVLIEEVKEETK